ncbi:hypothetical protein FAGAP_11241 [Fusarium agapanthi]|uniref:Uncharacterized protein n=1 Tax=Fusarium agapanthi TaxID=1803897 RepID=A0A9P5B0P6_9HYPO|nr:hypothetical protein FAGAP_11241 [Fusarium agapanthi]
MAFSNKSPVIGSVNSDASQIMQRAIAVGQTVADLVKESERSGEARAHWRLDSKIYDLRGRIDDLKLHLRACEEENADFREAFKASEKRTAEAEAKAKIDADTRIAQHTSDLEARNAQMVEAVAETVEKLKRDAAARVAAAETHADSQIRELSRDRDRKADMVSLARKHAAWGQHKLRLLLEKVYRMGYRHKDPLAHFVFEIGEDFGEFRNECDKFLDNGFLDDDVPDLGPVPEDEGGALFSRSYRNFPKAGKTGEEVNQPKAEASSSGEGTASHGDPSPSTKRANDSQGRAGHGGQASANRVEVTTTRRDTASILLAMSTGY